jgi:hypothetical protein
MSKKLTGVACAWLLIGLMPPAGAAAQGHFEVGVHYGKWSLNMLKPAIERVAEEVGDEIKNKQVDKIREQYPNLVDLSFVNHVEFDSSGNNFGFEARWYPGGENGSFSLGLAGEKTSMSFGFPVVSTAITLRDTRTGANYAFEGAGSGAVELNPFALIMTLRWDIIPSGRVNPYISLGGGAAGVSALDNIKLNWSYRGTLTSPGVATATITDASQKTLGQLKIEENFDYPVSLLPFVQLNLGLKVKASKAFHFLIDVGVLNGFVLRGGIGIRL